MKKNQSKFINFIKNRFNFNSKNGLYLTIGVILASFFTYVFFNFIEDLFGSNETLAVFDLNLLDRVQNIRKPLLNIFMLNVTHLGDWQNILIFSIILITVLAILSKWKQIIAISISTILGETFVYIAKNIIKKTYQKS